MELDPRPGGTRVVPRTEDHVQHILTSGPQSDSGPCENSRASKWWKEKSLVLPGVQAPCEKRLRWLNPKTGRFASTCGWGGGLGGRRAG